VYGFQTTRWSLIAAAAGITAQAPAALEELCKTYWAPVYSYVRQHGHSWADAQDLAQGFFTSLLQRNDLASVDRRRGRFRNWLLGALKNFLSKHWRHEHAQKRGGGIVVVSIDELAAGGGNPDEPTDPFTPEQLYDRRWALDLLSRALDRLEREYEAEGHGERFTQLRDFLVGNEPSYEELASRLGSSTPSALRVEVYRLRRRCRDLVRREIADTVERSADVEDELRYLLAAVAGGGSANGRR
jgi:RNA polymerase sigma-70 factor (ECF subfamily)